jgi:FO synthase
MTPDRDTLLQLAEDARRDELIALAASLRDAAWPGCVSHSRKVFIPLTRLCRDVCRYCTFATTPSELPAAYLPLEEVLSIARAGRRAGCREALFTLGDRPEFRYRAARDWLDGHGYASTVDYLEVAARTVLEETGLLPHINAGVLDEAEYRRLRAVAPSMGLMLESCSTRLCERGGPHFGSPDKHPAVRLESIAAAGRAAVPFTTGILVGIGETWAERVDSLLALRDLHDRHGHIQEIIVQNFRPKADTPMRAAPAAAIDVLCRSIALARLAFGPQVSIQAPPNLSPGELAALISAGLNDWGGVSPVTPDHVNPESPWPELESLAAATAASGRVLIERLTVYPKYIAERGKWIDARLVRAVLVHSDALGLARSDAWTAGASREPPVRQTVRRTRTALHCADPVAGAIARALAREPLGEDQICGLFGAQDAAVEDIVAAADALRLSQCGDRVTYVVNRNINYTNICGYRCGFCAFSKGRGAQSLRGKAYLLDAEEVARRALEAWQRGATEVCMQGGIHPQFTGKTYLRLLQAVKRAVPAMHVHAFSPLEVQHGARTLGLSVREYLERLRDAGLGSLPGTAAEILDDEVRAVICPDKLSTVEWLEIIADAHAAGLRTTATIMFGHVETPRSWARHLIAIRDQQRATGGFTEFVPLPFVHMEAPLYRRGLARPGPTWRENLLLHAVARLALGPWISNLQASWVKMSPQGVARLLHAGVNDLGGTLMDESISRAAGAAHGQEFTQAAMIELIAAAGREPAQRTTLYRVIGAGAKVHAAA